MLQVPTIRISSTRDCWGEDTIASRGVGKNLGEGEIIYLDIDWPTKLKSAYPPAHESHTMYTHLIVLLSQKEYLYTVVGERLQRVQGSGGA